MIGNETKLADSSKRGLGSSPIWICWIWRSMGM